MVPISSKMIAKRVPEFLKGRYEMAAVTSMARQWGHGPQDGPNIRRPLTPQMDISHPAPLLHIPAPAEPRSGLNMPAVNNCWHQLGSLELRIVAMSGWPGCSRRWLEHLPNLVIHDRWSTLAPHLKEIFGTQNFRNCTGCTQTQSRMSLPPGGPQPQSDGIL